MLEMTKNDFAWPSINSSINAVNYFHNLFLLEPIVIDKFIIDYCKRFARKVDRRKRPLLQNEFSKIVKTSSRKDLNVLELRNLVIVIFGYTGFLRYDDLSQLKVCDIDFFGSNVSITVPEGKADKNYKSQKVEVKLDHRCSDILRQYVKIAKFAKVGWNSNNAYFFMRISSDFVIHYQTKLSYKMCRSSVLGLCKSVGIDTKDLGLHSLRIGGCTEASRQGVPDFLLDLHGRWALGSSSRAGYQRLTPAEKHLVSSKLKTS